MHFGSVCSGIEAATVAWHDLGWRAAWLAEIDKFASAVLAHHYPSVPNLGDMTKIARAILASEVPAPDVLCGGTPCQAFSVAGLRESLADARGNLTIKFVEIANAIDHVRAGRGEDECIVFWENVPGVLSTKDNAFGRFLGGLAGEDGPLEPPGGKWANAGAVYGPRRAVAWRTLDAQYFGVAQRRRRVFVVASARKGFDPAAVLFEWDGMRRDTAPRREARQTAPTIPARSTAGGGLGTDFDCDGGLIAGTLQANGKAAGSATQQDAESGLLLPVAFGGNNQSGPIEVATARNACASASGRMDFETETFLVQPVAHVETMPTMTAGGPATTSHNQTSGQMRDQYVVPVVAGALCKDTYTGGMGGRPEAAAVGHVLPVAFPANLSATQHASTENLSPALGAVNPTAVAIQDVRAVNKAQNGRGWNDDGAAYTVDTHATQGVAYTTKLHNTGSNNAGKIFEDRTTSLDANSPPPALLTAMQVRRLTPEECEALQGFPRSYTAIPWRGKPAEQCPDGPRYKALGNSWAVPNVRWIGQRIDAAVRRLR